MYLLLVELQHLDYSICALSNQAHILIWTSLRKIISRDPLKVLLSSPVIPNPSPCWVLPLHGGNSLARKIGDVHKSVVEGRKNMAHTKYIFSFSHLRAKADDLFFLLFLPLARCHFLTRRKKIPTLTTKTPNVYNSGNISSLGKVNRTLKSSGSPDPGGQGQKSGFPGDSQPTLARPECTSSLASGETGKW